MKTILVSILILLGTIAYAQRTQPPDYILDGQKIVLEKTFMNPDNIDSMRVDRSTPGGTIYIYSKKPGMMFWNLDEVIKNHTEFEAITKTMVFYINGKLICNVSDIRIDKSYYIYVETDVLKQVQNISKKYNVLTIVKIDLERDERKPNISIRGENEFSNLIAN